MERNIVLPTDPDQGSRLVVSRAIAGAIGEIDSVMKREFLATPGIGQARLLLTQARTQLAALQTSVLHEPKKVVCAELAALVVLIEGALQVAGVMLPEIAIAAKTLAEAAAAFGCGLL